MSLAAMAIPSIFTPKTPSRPRNYHSLAREPLNSSPLASSPGSSPVSAAQARRRSQYKTHAINTPSSSRSRQPSRHNTSAYHIGSSPRAQSAAECPVPADEARRALLRERFRNQCFERAQKARERKIASKRRMSSDFSSDGADEDMDFEGSEDEDTILNDELFSRIMSSTKRKRLHQFRVSYAQDVGSSFDPDLDNITEWENDLREEPEPSLVPDDLEAEELAAYAQEYELGLDDLSYDEIFGVSDLEDADEEAVSRPPPSATKGKAKETGGEDVDMHMDA
ncbi:unnamed protein product [Somion occarium]|uniref:Uncharacterized protein n=1 Tax=Somion occarium TaxID=3059160 RepID=A0ABP1DQ09_9APHY